MQSVVRGALVALASCFGGMSDDFKGLKVRLGQSVRALRQDRGWSQEALADYAELDRTYISQIERASGNPSLRTIAKIAAALGVLPGDLLNRRFR